MSKTADLLVPPAPLLIKFGRRDDSDGIEQIAYAQRQIQNLRRTRDLLLPRLLSGQIDVEAIGHANGDARGLCSGACPLKSDGCWTIVEDPLIIPLARACRRLHP